MARYDEELNSAAGMSVDDILREFYAEQQSASSVPPKNSYLLLPPGIDEQ